MQGCAHLQKWMNHMQRIGHGQSAEMSSAEAIERANASVPAPLNAPFVDTHGIAAGERVTIAATDYGTDPVAGELVMSTPTELALRRTDPRAGEVVVHFPRLGFRLAREEQPR